MLQQMVAQQQAQRAPEMAEAAPVTATAASAAAPVAAAATGFVEGDPATWGNPSRNDPCPCGSGEKFKHCHGKIA